MFKKQKENLKNKLNEKKAEIKQAAKDKVVDAMPDSVKDIASAIKTKNASNYYEFNVAGCFYHKDDLASLGEINPDFENTPNEDERIYKFSSYTVSPVQLAFETGNKHDRNAIMVLVGGKFIGYVPMDENEYVGRLMKSNRVLYNTAWIYGGDYAFLDRGKRRIWSDSIECTVRIYYH